MPAWLSARQVRYFHREGLKEHGGLPGIKDEGALESTLARPQQLLACQPETSIIELAACYGFGFARNHVFVDGNKRIALVVIDVFLQLNGYMLTAAEEETVVVITDLASGELDETGLALWISQNSELFDL